MRSREEADVLGLQATLTKNLTAFEAFIEKFDQDNLGNPKYLTLKNFSRGENFSDYVIAIIGQVNATLMQLAQDKPSDRIKRKVHEKVLKDLMTGLHNEATPTLATLLDQFHQFYIEYTKTPEFAEKHLSEAQQLADVTLITDALGAVQQLNEKLGCLPEFLAKKNNDGGNEEKQFAPRQ